MNKWWIFLILVGLSVLVVRPVSAQTTPPSGKEDRSNGTKAAMVKEVDQFHELLHPLVHDALPNKDYNAIRKGLPALMASSAAIKNARLPQNMHKQKAAYKNAARKLQAQVEKLNKLKARLTDAELEERFAQIHETFELINAMTR